jgi:hypothetical protein
MSMRTDILNRPQTQLKLEAVRGHHYGRARARHGPSFGEGNFFHYKSALTKITVTVSSETVQMCVAKPGRILETVPKQAIDANVGGPNQPIGQQPKLLVDDREYDEQ